MKYLVPALIAGLIFAILAPDLAAQRNRGDFSFRRGAQTHTINGIAAWSVARENGFKFRPTGTYEWSANGRTYDGRVLGDGTGENDRVFAGETRLGAVRAGTTMTAEKGELWWIGTAVHFEMFAGKRLATGWTIEDIDLAGTFVWVKRPPRGSNDPSFVIKVSMPERQSRTVAIRSIKLKGPRGQSWHQAFTGR